MSERHNVMASRLYVEWLDVDLEFIRTSNYVATPAGVAAYLTALQSVSNAGESVTTLGPASFPNNAPVDAAYPSGSDTAVLLYRTLPGQTIRVIIPAPKSNIFLTDQLTVDPVAVAALNVAVIGALGDALGNVPTAFLTGARASRRRDMET
jgi:hypothetical protein